MSFVTRESCRVCGEGLVPFLELGEVPLAGRFLEAWELETEQRYPLTLSWCPGCTLVQCREVVDSELLFGRYRYRSSLVGPVDAHFARYADQLWRLGARRVLEIGGNDGPLVKRLAGAGAFVVNVDPSDVAAAHAAAGVRLYNEPFTAELARSIADELGTFDVVTASNCLAHVDDVHDVVAGARSLLGDRGELWVEVHWLGALVENLQFPFVYHEHRSYFSLASMEALLALHGGSVVDVELLPLHGGLLRCRCVFSEDNARSAAIERLRERERAMKLGSLECLQAFAARVTRTCERLSQELRKVGGGIYAYGASGQSTTLLNCLDLNGGLELMLDDSPTKIGLYTPGTHLPIVSSDVLAHDPPSHVLLTAYTMRDAITRRHAGYRGAWIVPLPELEIFGGPHG